MVATKTITMTIIPVKGKIERRAISEPPSLEELQEVVGGYIEVVNVRTKGQTVYTEMVINEDGQMRGLEINHRAMDLVESVGGHMPIVVGTVALFSEPVVQ